MNKNTLYAPIVIPTLNRYKHFKECIESLQKNEWAKYTDLYIALDYPPSEKYIEGYSKISRYLDEGICGFASVNIVRREKNFGAGTNCIEMRKEVFKKYDRMIVTEDDNVFSPCFIEYMDKTLEYFYHDSSVVAISGYSLPVEWKEDGNNIVSSEVVFCAWGYGLWRDKEERLSSTLTLKRFRDYCKNKTKIEQLREECPRAFCYYILHTLSLNFKICDTVRQAEMIIHNQRCVIPRLSMSRNMGWDGSGLHGVSEKDFDLGFSKQEIETEKTFDIILKENSLPNHFENVVIANKILPASERFARRSNIIWKLICILSPDVFFAIESCLYRLYKMIKRK